jgi:hypothetical protein
MGEARARFRGEHACEGVAAEDGDAQGSTGKSQA